MKEPLSFFKMISNRRTLTWLFVPVILLPMGMVFLFIFGRFFALLHDSFSAAVLDWLALGFGFFWFLSLITMLLLVAWQLSFNSNHFDNLDNSDKNDFRD